MTERLDNGKYYFAATVIWGLFFMCIYIYWIASTVNFSDERILNSPDETANMVFTKQFTEKNTVKIKYPLNSIYNKVLFPRSVGVAEDGSLVPGSFLGLAIIYGLIAKVFGEWIIIYLTPFFAFFASIYYFKFLKNIFWPSAAFVATILLSIFPGWWYYSSRSMFHNVLFVSLVIFCFYNFQKYFIKKRRRHLAFSVIFLGLAVLTRTSEALWLLPLYLIFFFLNRKNFPWKHFFIVAVFGMIFFLIILFLNRSVFGNAIFGAYDPENTNSPLNFFKNIIMPFGFHPKRSIVNFFNYYAKSFWWFFIFFAFGFILVWKNFLRITAIQRIYALFFSIVSVALIFYYGSWRIVDNLDPEKITIGTSYVRYWLPLYVFSLPFVAISLEAAIGLLKKPFFKVAGTLFFIFIFPWLSYQAVWVKGDESLHSIQKSIKEYYLKRDMVSNIIPETPIIMTERSDKIFFPKYMIISQPNEAKVLDNVKKLIADRFEVYYYTFRSQEDIKNYEDILAPFGLVLRNKTKIFSNEYLFSVNIL